MRKIWGAFLFVLAAANMISAVTYTASAQPDPRIQAQARGVSILPARRNSHETSAIAIARALSVPPTSSAVQPPSSPLPAQTPSLPPQLSLRGNPVIPEDLRAMFPQGIGPMPEPEEQIRLLAADFVRPAPEQSLLARGDRNTCLKHIDEAERLFQIPRGILRAIAYVESSWGGAPWPWTMNTGGRSYYFTNLSEAAMAATLPNGRLRDADLGCMQINTRWHGHRFRDASHILDPRTNVFYAGWYLRLLYLQYGSWHEAVARYHSSQAIHQRAYLCRVVSVRMQLGLQNPNQWFAQTCPGGMQTYLAWTQLHR